MADTIQVLAQAFPSPGVLTTLYTAASPTVVSSLMVCNQASGTPKYRVAIAVGGAADDPKQYLRFDALLVANEARTVVAGITLGAGDVVRVQNDLGTVSFNLFGVIP